MVTLCENPTTKWLRQKYHAFPIEVPEARYRPLILLERKRNDFGYLGGLDLIVNNEIPDLPVKESLMADSALDRTSSMDISVGMKVLGGFFKVLGMDPPALSAAFKNVKEIALSFTQAKRNYVEVLHIGKVWKELDFDYENPLLEQIKKDRKLKLLLITDAITTKDFTIIEQKSGGQDFNVDVPMINQYITDANLNVGLKTDNKSSITFSGETPLTFAMSCAQLGFDASGKLIIEQAIVRKGAEEKPQELDYRVILDEDAYEPSMLRIS